MTFQPDHEHTEHVSAYQRTRFGQRENVRQYWRRARRV